MQDPYVLGYVALADAGDVDEIEAVTGIGGWCETRGWRLARVIHDIAPDVAVRAWTRRSASCARAAPRAWSSHVSATSPTPSRSSARCCSGSPRATRS